MEPKRIFISLIKQILNKMHYKIFIVLYPYIKKTVLCDVADIVFYHRFLERCLVREQHGDTLLNSPKKKFIVIKKGLWDYNLCNFCFVKDMLANIVWCIERGYIPIVNIYPSQDASYTTNDNLWEMFYHQPLQNELTNQIYKCKKICPINISSIRPNFIDARNHQMVKIWHIILDTYVVYNKKTQQYFDDEYNRLIKGRSVLACVLRSTDYTKLKPKGHPVQPTVEEVFVKIHAVMNKYSIDSIYLATEDGKIADEFKKEFPNQIIENKRRYFNEQFEKNGFDLVSQVHFNRENDDYYKMLEYLSSINIVSKCDYLVTGLNGGSEMAIFRNGNNYKYIYIFNKGYY